MRTSRNTARFVVLLTASLLLSGCNAVLVEKPVGDTVVKLDPAIWQGTWVSNEVVILTTVLDGDQGLLQAAWVERGAQGEGARFESVTGTVRQTGDITFLNMEKEPLEERGSAPADGAEAPTTEAVSATAAADPAAVVEAAGPAQYIWGRIDNNGQRIILWLPNVEQFRLAVQDGRLPGTVIEDEDVLLGALDPKQLELVNSPTGNLLSWSEPGVFIRIGN